MRLIIGEYYCFSTPYRNGERKWKYGILKEVFDINGVIYVKFTTRDNVDWSMPLHTSLIKESKED